MSNNILVALRRRSRVVMGMLGIVLILLSVATLAFRVQMVEAEPETIVVPDDYPTIQEAIDAASPGDTVYVKAGTYEENIDLTKAIRLTGEDSENTIIDGGSIPPVDLHGTDNAILERFTIKGCGHLIFGDGANNNTIRRNIILLSGSDSRGIELRESLYNHICNNNITEIGDMQPCMHGIRLGYEDGIYGSSYNFIYGNHIENNDVAIEIAYSMDNTIYHNNIVNSTDCQADVNPGRYMNFWNDTYPSGGNYWSDYGGTDENDDGIGDTPYPIISENIDYFPLMTEVVHDVAIISVTASPSEAYDGESVNVTVIAENQGNRVKETFDATTYYGDTPIGTQTVSDLPPGENTTLTFQWDTHSIPDGNYTIRAEAEDVGPLEAQTADNTLADCTVEVHQTVRYMQNTKWDSTYWKQLWNNTSTYTSQACWRSGLISVGYLGVKVYKGTTCISGDSAVQVGAWLVDQDTIKSTTWGCSEQNVTGTYVKVEIWYKFDGYSWTSMGVAFKSQNFTQNTIMNATTWTIYLYGRVYQVSPLGPPIEKTYITFYWGSPSKESRIENMSFFTY